MHKLLETYPGKIRFVLKNYPYKYRDYSRLAAEAFLAAADQGKAWEMHELLLEKSPKLDLDSLKGYAGHLGLDMKRFNADLKSMKHDSQIQQEHDLAIRLDLYNTPTFFINGIKVVGNRSFEYLQRIVEAELHNAQ